MSTYCHFLDASAQEQHSLLVKKLNQCSIVFDFDDPVVDIKSKEVKRSALNEVIEFIGNPRTSVPENLYYDIIKMVRGCLIYTIYCYSFTRSVK